MSGLSKDRPAVAVCWADVPGLSSRVGSWLRAWQQCWQQLSVCLQIELSPLRIGRCGPPRRPEVLRDLVMGHRAAGTKGAYAFVKRIVADARGRTGGTWKSSQ